MGVDRGWGGGRGRDRAGLHAVTVLELSRFINLQAAILQALLPGRAQAHSLIDK